MHFLFCRKITFHTILLILAVFWAVPELSAEVYLLGPRTGPRPKGQGLPERSFQELVRLKKLMSEPVICNGAETQLQISLITGSLEELLRELRVRYPDLQFQVRKSGVRFSIKLGKHLREQVLLVGAEGRVTSFVMQLPDPMPPMPPWPDDLPLPPGAEMDEVIRFTRRQSVYGSFHHAEPGALNRLSTSLAASGFLPVTREADSPSGKGELFLNAGQKKLLLISIGEKGTGTMLLSPLTTP